MKNLIVSAVSALKDLSTTFSAPKAPGRTTEQLIGLVVACVNTWTEHGQLTNLKAYPDDQPYWDNLIGNLTSMGFKVLGNGYFSFVVAHPELPQRVLKVGLKKEDSAAAYIAWCRMNKGRAGVPNVYGTKRSTGCYVVEMDHLLPLNTDNDSERLGWMVAYDGIFGRNNGIKVPHLKALYETAQSIREFFDGLAKFDLHTENVMVDIHGNVVITDPVSYSQDDEGERSSESWSFLDDGEALNNARTSAKARKESREAAERARNEARVEVRKAQLRDWFMPEDMLKHMMEDRLRERPHPRGWVRPAGMRISSKAFDKALLQLPEAHFAELEAIAAKVHRNGLVGALAVHDAFEMVPPPLRGVADRDGNIVTDLDKELDARFRG